MKIIIIFALFSVIALQQTITIVASSPSNTIITAPTSQAAVANTYHNTNNPNFFTGAQWISKVGGDSVANGATFTFQTQFYSDCQNNAILNITADNSFSASLNGGAAMTGNVLYKPYPFTLSLKCGLNTLTVTVVNADAGSPMALIFVITQDQTGCYTCKTPLAFYNKDTCKCECNGGCDCKSANGLLAWQDYPTCGCQCSNAASISCPKNKYFNQKTCSCQCIKVACPPGKIQDSNTCECIKDQILCIALACPTGQIRNPTTCICQCDTLPCPAGKVKDPNTCQCVNQCMTFATFAPCPSNTILNQVTCNCDCISPALCTYPYVLDSTKCGCTYTGSTGCLTKPAPCGQYSVWNPAICRCVP